MNTRVNVNTTGSRECLLEDRAIVQGKTESSSACETKAVMNLCRFGLADSLALSKSAVCDNAPAASQCYEVPGYFLLHYTVSSILAGSGEDASPLQQCLVLKRARVLHDRHTASFLRWSPERDCPAKVDWAEVGSKISRQPK